MQQQNSKLYEIIKHKSYTELRINNLVYNVYIQIFRGDHDTFYDEFINAPGGEGNEEGKKRCKWLWWYACIGYSIIWLNRLSRNTVTHELLHIIFSQREQIMALPFDVSSPKDQEFICYNLDYYTKIISKTKLAKKLERDTWMVFSKR